MKLFCLSVVVVFSVVLGGCGGTMNTTTSTTNPNETSPHPPPPASMPPNTAMIKGTLTAIDTSFHIPVPPNKETTIPYPRSLFVHIDEVDGYGPGKPGPVAVGQIVSVKFLGPPPPPLPTMEEMKKNPPPPPPPLETVVPGMKISGMIESLGIGTPKEFQMMRYEIIH